MLQPDALNVVSALPIDEKRTDRVLASHLSVAIGADDQDRTQIGGPRKTTEGLRRAITSVMEILEHQHHRSDLTRPTQQIDQRLIGGPDRITG